MKTSVASFAKTSMGCFAVLLGAMGIVAEATAGESNASFAGKRGLSPIVPIVRPLLFKTDLNLTQGEVTMFIPDMPNLPPQDAPVMIAQASQAQAGDTAKIRTMGVCAPAPNHNYSLENVRDPILTAGYYLQAYENRNPPGSATTAILQPPKHGVLRLVTEADRGTLFGRTADPLDPNASLYAYLPDANYVGNDTATILVDFGNGLKVNVKYFFQAVNRGGLGDDWVGTYCSKTGPYWKISSTLDANGNSTVTSVEYQSPTIAASESRGQVLH